MGLTSNMVKISVLIFTLLIACACADFRVSVETEWVKIAGFGASPPPGETLITKTTLSSDLYTASVDVQGRPDYVELLMDGTIYNPFGVFWPTGNGGFNLTLNYSQEPEAIIWDIFKDDGGWTCDSSRHPSPLKSYNCGTAASYQ